jgi:hypothetical protein
MQYIFGYFAAITFQNPKQNSNILNGMVHFSELFLGRELPGAYRTCHPNIRLSFQRGRNASHRSREFHSNLFLSFRFLDFFGFFLNFNNFSNGC